MIGYFIIMGSPFRLRNFCCCCTLRTGTLITGTFGWILTILKLLGLVHVVLEPLISGVSRSRNDIQSRTIVPFIFFGFFSLFASIFLILGVHKKRKSFLLPWLISQCIECILLSIALVLCFFLIIYSAAKNREIFIIILVILLIICSLCWYFWLCVWSYFKELNERR